MSHERNGGGHLAGHHASLAPASFGAIVVMSELIPRIALASVVRGALAQVQAHTALAAGLAVTIVFRTGQLGLIIVLLRLIALVALTLVAHRGVGLVQDVGAHSVAAAGVLGLAEIDGLACHCGSREFAGPCAAPPELNVCLFGESSQALTPGHVESARQVPGGQPVNGIARVAVPVGLLTVHKRRLLHRRSVGGARGHTAADGLALLRRIELTIGAAHQVKAGGSSRGAVNGVSRVAGHHDLLLVHKGGVGNHRVVNRRRQAAQHGVAGWEGQRLNTRAGAGHLGAAGGQAHRRHRPLADRRRCGAGGERHAMVLEGKLAGVAIRGAVIIGERRQLVDLLDERGQGIGSLGHRRVATAEAPHTELRQRCRTLVMVHTAVPNLSGHTGFVHGTHSQTSTARDGTETDVGGARRN
mmetsp:Transcript_26014/g.57449  ORF Transcript_26014/g.57449 Transcript_26014/m.57449 type:complete len:414 (-) Transcript_26014:5716-6957(-)